MNPNPESSLPRKFPDDEIIFDHPSAVGNPPDRRNMIQLKTILNCIDNSGAALVECVHVLNGSKRAYIGDRIVCVVQRVRLQTAQQAGNKQITTVIPKVNRGDVRRAIVVRTKQQVQRKDGSIVRFDDNACVLIDDKGEPIGTRILGLVARELADKVQANKIMSLAPKVV